MTKRNKKSQTLQDLPRLTKQQEKLVKRAENRIKKETRRLLDAKRSYKRRSLSEEEDASRAIKRAQNRIKKEYDLTAEKVYHPYHQDSSSSEEDDNYLDEMYPVA